MKDIQPVLQNIQNTNNTQNNLINNNNQIINNYYNNNNNIQQNFFYESDDEKYMDRHINDFGKEDISFISDEAMKDIVDNNDVKLLIELKHFNDEHPENLNIRRGDKKRNFYKILKDQQWKYESRETIIEDVSDKSYTFLKKLKNGNKIMEPCKYEERAEKNTKKKLNKYVNMQISIKIDNKPNELVKCNSQNVLQNIT